MSKWKPVSEMDATRRNHCRIRLEGSGRELEAIWGVYRTRRNGETWCWACSDEVVRGLYDVSEFKLLGSLPIGSLPGGECTDAELLADRKNAA